MNFTIQSRVHPYQVVEAASLAEALKVATASSSPFLLADRKVHDLHRASIEAFVPSDKTYLIDASEEMKSYEKLGPVFCRLIESKFQRNSHLIVLGGGVLQDIGCFIASVLFRGVAWSLLPTTLLAQCDSCIGSKSSLNIHGYKNQLGTFYPPNSIHLIFDLLSTLSPGDMLSGLGEAIKLHLIDGEESFARLQKKLSGVPPDKSVLSSIVWDCLAIKKRYIEEDEMDRGIRNLLNYGHTFAHAFESATHYEIPHGIAVSLGVWGATFFSDKLGLVPAGEHAALRDWLLPYCGGHELRLKDVNPDDVLSAMRMDKKNQGESITFILTRGPGRLEKMPLNIEAQVKPWLRDFLTQSG
jgi:3-dehydroquinate synthase